MAGLRWLAIKAKGIDQLSELLPASDYGAPVIAVSGRREMNCPVAVS